MNTTIFDVVLNTANRSFQIKKNLLEITPCGTKITVWYTVDKGWRAYPEPHKIPIEERQMDLVINDISVHYDEDNQMHQVDHECIDDNGREFGFTVHVYDGKTEDDVEMCLNDWNSGDCYNVERFDFAK